MLGRIIASVTGRDSGAKQGDGVRLRAGDGADFDGSVKNWTTKISVNSEFIVHDIPLLMAKDYVSGKRQSRNVVVEILVSADTGADETTGLTAERSTLMTRMAEIDALLN